MALIDFVNWNPGQQQIYAWKYPHTNLSTYTQLVVAESQEAVLFSKGMIVGKFGPGKHTLNTENLPLLRKLYGIPFGGNNPFTAEVWFVNKVMPLNIDWETDNMRLHDPDYRTMVPLMAKGRYGLKVVDAERFLVKLVGTIETYTGPMLTDHFMGPLVSKTKSLLLQSMQSQQIGIKSIGAYLDPLSKTLQEAMQPFWEDFGFSLVGLYITSIEIDSRTSDGVQILEAMAQQSAQSIAGYTWQQKQGFDVAKDAVNGQSELGIMGLMMVAGGMGGMSGVGSAMMQQPAPNQAQGPVASGQWGSAPPAVRDVFCSNCSKKFPNDNRFCPHCGDPYTPCSRCGADNESSAVRCVTCGLSLVAQSSSGMGNKCSRCGAVVNPKVMFCPSCGIKQG